MYLIFNPALSSALERLSSEPSLGARICSSIERLKTALPKKDDVIIIDIADIEPSALRKRLSSPNAMIALYDPDKIKIPRLLSYQHAVYLPYDYSEDELGKAMECAERIRDEIGTLKDMLVGDSEVMEALRRTIERIIKTRQRIFHIAGETGTGKNLVAQYIRQVCLPKNRRSVYESCCALDGELAESRFFGHAKGAYTGATDQVDGIVSMADGGILFLDEIEDLPLGMQSKLLHLMETGEYRSIGDDRMKKSEFMLITASNIDMQRMVMEKKMRNDFYHRISGITLRMPSLSEHMEDIPRLIEHIEEAIGVSVQDRITDYAPFLSREWSGNVRELFNAVRMYHIGLPG